MRLTLIAAVTAVVAVAVVLGMATGAGAGGGSRLYWLLMVGQKRIYRKPWLRMVGQKRSHSAARLAAATGGRSLEPLSRQPDRQSRASR